MTTLYLAVTSSVPHILAAFPQRPDPPAILVSNAYATAFFNKRDRFCIREVVFDSGAFTNFTTGKDPISVSRYIDICKALRTTERQLSAVFALDVVGDWRATIRNTEAMWKAGVEAIPCFHAGEPEDALIGMAKDYPRIAIGGAAGRLFGDKRFKFLEQCLQRVWPKRVHCFGVTDFRLLERLPFDSADSSSWDMRPGRYGTMQSMAKAGEPGVYLGARTKGSGPRRLLPEVNWYLALEAKLKAKWGKELANL